METTIFTCFRINVMVGDISIKEAFWRISKDCIGSMFFNIERIYIATGMYL